ncbi:MAG: hypothetical protein ACFHX7_08115 [Pseudomonadota bacterium]
MKTKPIPWNPLGVLRQFLVAGVLAGMAQFATADAKYAAEWGPAVGTTAPMLAALDQHGKAQSLETLTGSKGLLFIFNRSVDW